MILDFDDYPVHQTAATLDEAATSDLRFFDRYWFSVIDPAQRFGLIAGLGVYKNMDVMDGFVSIARHGQQHNLRVSRRLRPDWMPFGAGPYRVEILEPMRRHRLTLAPNDQGIACELELQATGPAFEEAYYLTRDRGWLEKDYQRLFQAARATGWVEVDGERFHSGPDGWPTARDRSFGVRPGMGGPMPSRGDAMASGIGAHEALVFAGMFETPDHYGTWSLSEDAAGELLFVSGAIHDRTGQRREMHGVRHALSFSPGSRALESGRVQLTDTAGHTHALDLLATARFVYQGFGYGNGWGDRKGLGAWRGELASEGERYDLRNPARVVDESGRHSFTDHGMFHCQFTMELDGQAGHGECIAVLMPEHARYGVRR